MRLSVVVPAYQEAASIAASVATIRSDLADLGEIEIVVVDDGSTDATAVAAREGGADRVIELRPNQGKGAAVRAGMAAATGAVRVFTDADLSYRPAQIAALVELAEAGTDVVVGNRYDDASTTLVEASVLRRVGGRGINFATRAVLKGRYRDTQSGLKAFRGEVAAVIFQHCRIDGFAFDVEVLHLVERYGLSLAEVPVEVSNTETSSVNVVRDALGLLFDLARIRRYEAKGVYELDQAQRMALSSGHPAAGE